MHSRKPDWLIIRKPNASEPGKLEEVVERLSLHTVCEQAGCPNKGECFGGRTAAFLILGNTCTRDCTFCMIAKGTPQRCDPLEPEHVADAVRELNLEHAVITSVTRDDLPDGGSGHFARTIESIRRQCPDVTIEVLIPDFQGDASALGTVIQAKPTIINHNIETVERLYPQVRPMASYARSLELLARVKTIDPAIKTKSGLMAGLGEKRTEVIEAMRDLRSSGCDFLTIGQYLAPSKAYHPVMEYVHPDVFQEYKAISLELGFTHTEAGPFVRSSYHAKNALV